VQEASEVPTRAGFIAGGSAAVLLATKANAAPPMGTSVVPTDVLLHKLLDGNRRFVDGKLVNRDGIAERREALAEGQAPYAAILTCSDSRVPPELVFDQHIGDLFVTRIAGNFASDDVLGSLEYTFEHLGTRLIVVLGHEKCGAVKATYDAIASHTPLPGYLLAIERGIRPAIEPVVRTRGSVDAAIRANVKATVTRISQAEPVLKKGAEAHALRVVAAEYRLATGTVEVLSRDS
jgi:carbonic anhydrase